MLLVYFEQHSDADGVELTQDLLESIFYSFRIARDNEKKPGALRYVFLLW